MKTAQNTPTHITVDYVRARRSSVNFDYYKRKFSACAEGTKVVVSDYVSDLFPGGLVARADKYNDFVERKRGEVLPTDKPLEIRYKSSTLYGRSRTFYRVIA